MDQTVDEYADITGVPASIVRSDEEVIKIRGQRQQAQQAQNAAATAAQGAETAKGAVAGGYRAQLEPAGRYHRERGARGVNAH